MVRAAIAATLTIARTMQYSTSDAPDSSANRLTLDIHPAGAAQNEAIRM
jgi:hypothetical protein